jgi:hypothetical protein
MSDQTLYEMATELWAKFDENQKTAVRIGMFPHDIMKEYDADLQHALCLALMAIAADDGGMIA